MQERHAEGPVDDFLLRVPLLSTSDWPRTEMQLSQGLQGLFRRELRVVAPCESCSGRMWQRLKIRALPDTIVIQLKRHSERGSLRNDRLVFERNNTIIEYPLGGLDMSVHVKEAGLYDLRAVAHHRGADLESGHCEFQSHTCVHV